MDVLSPTNGENTAIENCPSTRVQTIVSDKEVTIAQFFRKFLEQKENAKYLYSLCTPSTNRIKNDTVLHYGDGFSTRVLFVPEESREDTEIVKGSIVLEMKVKTQNQVYDVLGRGEKEHCSCILLLCTLNVMWHEYTDIIMCISFFAPGLRLLSCFSSLLLCSSLMSKTIVKFNLCY